MKLSFVLPTFWGAGGINVVYEYSKRLVANGHDVVIYSPIIAYNMHKGDPFVDLLKQVFATFKVLKWICVDHVPSRIKEGTGLTIKPVLRINDKYIRKSDVVIATAWCTAFDVSKLVESKGEKVYFIQGLELWDNQKMGMLSYQLPLKKIVIAKWIKDRLVSECGCNADEIDIVNNGIDCEIFNIAEKEYEHDGPIRCLMLDHTLPIKGVKFGVEAYQKAKTLNPRLSLTMFGMKKSNYVPKDVYYFLNPPQDKLINLYREADIFIFPSIEEGWGMTPIEAMACKCAVVGTNVACMLDIGKNGENAILCEPGNTNALAQGILKLAENSQFRRTIAENGFKSIQQLNWSISSAKFENILIKFKDSTNYRDYPQA